jgi:hypothetical protein
MPNHSVLVLIAQHRFEHRKRRSLFHLTQTVCEFVLEQGALIFKSWVIGLIIQDINAGMVQVGTF